MLIAGAVLALAVLIGVFTGAGAAAFLWLRLLCKGLNPLAYGAIYALAVLLILASFVVSRIPDTGVPRAVFTVGHYALGVLLYIVIVADCAALLLLLGRLARVLPSPLPKAVLLPAGAVCLILAAALSVYGFLHASAIRTSRYTVRLGEVQAEAEPLRIALVSDLHLGYVSGEAHLAKVFAAVNAAEPDIVCLAGDFFDGDITSLSDPAGIQALLRGLDAKHGVYACLGNHDAGRSYAQMIAFLSEAGVRVLQDEAAVIGDRVLLFGRKESAPIGGQGAAREPRMQLPEGNTLPVIVMDHQPGNNGEYGAETDLILCGHTHRGQMFPFNLITDAVYDVDYGYYRASDTAPQVVVTSGAGTWGPPLRVATDNEIAEILVLLPK